MTKINIVKDKVSSTTTKNSDLNRWSFYLIIYQSKEVIVFIDNNGTAHNIADIEYYWTGYYVLEVIKELTNLTITF